MSQLIRMVFCFMYFFIFNFRRILSSYFDNDFFATNSNPNGFVFPFGFNLAQVVTSGISGEGPREVLK